jgi:hypothetical protein
MKMIWQFIQSHWQALTALAVGVFAVWKYFDSRASELAWRRTEFLFEQARLLDTDPDLSAAVLILEGRDPEVQLSDLFSEGQDPFSKSSRTRHYQHMDKLLNFLDRLAYAVLDARTLSVSEVANFGWYFRKVSEHPGLCQYCKATGFGDIIVLLDELKKKKRKTRGLATG